MTECPKCKGYGIVGSSVPDILRGRGHIFSSNECDMCHGSGEVPMTNEEWLKQANTEQLATFLAIVQYDGTDLTLKKNQVEKWVEWLKEKHE
jgi:hypothetical protein